MMARTPEKIEEFYIRFGSENELIGPHPCYEKARDAAREGVRTKFQFCTIYGLQPISAFRREPMEVTLSGDPLPTESPKGGK